MLSVIQSQEQILFLLRLGDLQNQWGKKEASEFVRHLNSLCAAGYSGRIEITIFYLSSLQHRDNSSLLVDCIAQEETV